MERHIKTAITGPPKIAWPTDNAIGKLMDDHNIRPVVARSLAQAHIVFERGISRHIYRQRLLAIPPPHTSGRGSRAS